MSNERILIVEDEPPVMNSLGALLCAAGYEVTGAATVAEAMRALRVEIPDLMVLDLTLLDADPFGGLSDGFAFIQVLRRSFRDLTFPIIIHTAEESPTLEARAQAAGVFALCRKGCDPAELLSAIREALDQSQVQAAG